MLFFRFCRDKSSGKGKAQSMRIVTNNEKVRQELDGRWEVQMVDGGYGDVLTAVRDLVHKGWRLLTHPLSGSVKPGQTPYKSVLVEQGDGVLDTDSLRILEDSLAAFRTQTQRAGKSRVEWQRQLAEDFREVDYQLLAGALQSAAGPAGPAPGKDREENKS